MIAYILIVIFNGGAGHMGFTARFDNLKACQAAKTTIEASMNYMGPANIFCVSAK